MTYFTCQFPCTLSSFVLPFIIVRVPFNFARLQFYPHDSNSISSGYNCSTPIGYSASRTLFHCSGTSVYRRYFATICSVFVSHLFSSVSRHPSSLFWWWLWYRLISSLDTFQHPSWLTSPLCIICCYLTSHQYEFYVTTYHSALSSA